MSIKALCVTVLVFTVLIVGANYYAVRNAAQSLPECRKCDCTVKLVSVMGKPNVKEPSCSVVFTIRAGPRTGELAKLSLTRAKEEIPIGDYACAWTVFCDNTHLSHVLCSGLDVEQVSVNPQTQCGFQCLPRQLLYNCPHWVRPTPNPTPRKRGSPSQAGSLWPQFFDATTPNTSILSGFLPVRFIATATDDEATKAIITGSTRWRPIQAEAGIEGGMLMVVTGAAEARSFCTGDSLRLAGPGTVSLPSCHVNLSGSWWGAYARRGSDSDSEPVAVSLNLREVADALGGELTTSDGIFNIVSASESNSGLELQAARTVAGRQQKIILHGRITKGEIVFDGTEQPLSGDKTHRLQGVLKRLYIADNALPPAAVNQPYSFTLVSVSPNDKAVRFRLSNPIPKQPDQITWTTAADSLRGRNGERFTYLCPANGTLNRSLYRGNAYTDDSSICTAAVNSHVINQQAGGVVTIQIQPGPSPDTGRFVIVTGEPRAVEPQGGERGRLPKGLSFDSQSGTFSGTPTELGSFEISVVAEDGGGNVFEQPLTLVVKKMVVTNGLLLDGFVGQPYAATLKVAGGQPPYRFSGTPPQGLQLDPITGELSGRPSSPGSYSSFEVTVRDSQNISESQKLRLSVRRTTILTSHFLPDARVGVPYRMQFQAVGNVTPISWVFGRADASSIGLALNAGTGELAGTPTKAGNIFIDVRAEGGSSVPARRFALTIK